MKNISFYPKLLRADLERLRNASKPVEKTVTDNSGQQASNVRVIIVIIIINSIIIIIIIFIIIIFAILIIIIHVTHAQSYFLMKIEI